MQTGINSEPATAPARAKSSSRLRGLFYGPCELRVGSRLTIFVVTVLVLILAKNDLIRRLPHSSDQATNYLLDKILKLAVLLSASRIMARIEARTIADYGLPWGRMFGQRFWKGAAMAFLGLTGFLTLHAPLEFSVLERLRCTAMRFGNGAHSTALGSSSSHRQTSIWHWYLSSFAVLRHEMDAIIIELGRDEGPERICFSPEPQNRIA